MPALAGCGEGFGDQRDHAHDEIVVEELGAMARPRRAEMADGGGETGEDGLGQAGVRRHRSRGGRQAFRPPPAWCRPRAAHRRSGCRAAASDAAMISDDAGSLVPQSMTSWPGKRWGISSSRTFSTARELETQRMIGVRPRRERSIVCRLSRAPLATTRRSPRGCDGR